MINRLQFFIVFILILFIALIERIQEVYTTSAKSETAELRVVLFSQDLYTHNNNQTISILFLLHFIFS